jgi:hypothetical protein
MLGRPTRSGIKKPNKQIIRQTELPQADIIKRGSDLLQKIVGVIPKNLNKAEIVVNLALHPDSVVDYVVKAFRAKGWKARHSYSDRAGVKSPADRYSGATYYHPYDHLILTMPEDWHLRVLQIGKYSQVSKKVAEVPVKFNLPIQE